jgi:hypothetical protein
VSSGTGVKGSSERIDVRCSAPTLFESCTQQQFQVPKALASIPALLKDVNACALWQCDHQLSVHRASLTIMYNVPVAAPAHHVRVLDA